MTVADLALILFVVIPIAIAIVVLTRRAK